MSEKSNYSPFCLKLDTLCDQIIEKIAFYCQTNSKLNSVLGKVVFLGINLYPNGVPYFPNYDILYIKKALQEFGLITRMHDPHIRGSQGLSQGFWLGRHDGSDNWAHSYDVLILSCPHLFYIQNIDKLSHLFKPDKSCMLLDLYGAFTSAYKIGEYIDIVNFSSRTKKAELMGGFPPVRRLSE